MNTPTPSIPQAPGMSPTGASVPRTGPGLDLMGQFTAEAEAAGLEVEGQSGGREEKPAKKNNNIHHVPQVRRPVPPPFPAMVGLPQGRQPSPLTLQEITSENMTGMSLVRQLSEGGRIKRKYMKKKKTKKRKSMKKKKTKRRKTMKNRK